MSISEEDKKELLGLMWALKPSDLSILIELLKEPKEAIVGTVKHSGNYLFYSKLAKWGLAEEKKDPLEKLDDEYKDIKERTLGFSLTKEGKFLITRGLDHAFRTGWPPQQSYISNDTLKLLDIYTNENIANSKTKLATLYMKGIGVEKDINEALRLFQAAANLKDTSAACNIGHIYYTGIDIPQDIQKAVGWFKKAAELGDNVAMDNLGSIYLSGNGVSKNYPEALKWLKQAADLRNGNAMCRLGDIYREGLGTSINFFQSYVWYSLGIKHGVSAAKSICDSVAKNLSDSQIKEADAYVNQWPSLKNTP